MSIQAVLMRVKNYGTAILGQLRRESIAFWLGCSHP